MPVWDVGQAERGSGGWASTTVGVPRRGQGGGYSQDRKSVLRRNYVCEQQGRRKETVKCQWEQCVTSEAITVSTELKNWSMRFVTRALCEDRATSEACGSYGFQGI